MTAPGPQLEVLTRRLAETPAEFLMPPRIGKGGTLHVAAVVNDVAARLGARLTAPALARLQGDGADDAGRLGIAAVLAWLLAEEWFVAAQPMRTAPEGLLDLLDATAADLAQSTKAQQFVADAERREELARVALARLGLHPAGESADQAADRLTAISGMERRRLLLASRAAEARAEKIRAALARQAAEEAADKWTRE